VEVRAIAKDTGQSPKKMRPIVDMVRGKKVNEALSLLRFTPTPKAKVVAKLIRSAAANAENNFQMDPADLKIVRIYVGDARSLRRYRPRSRGRVSPIRKHSSHITVVIAEQEG
jgi:large subunit ribosomal protein L22